MIPMLSFYDHILRHRLSHYLSYSSIYFYQEPWRDIHRHRCICSCASFLSVPKSLDLFCVSLSLSQFVSWFQWLEAMALLSFPSCDSCFFHVLFLTILDLIYSDGVLHDL